MCIVRVKIAVLAIVVPGTPVIKVAIAISQRLNVLFTSNLLQRCKKHCIYEIQCYLKKNFPDICPIFAYTVTYNMFCVLFMSSV